jgi:dihydrofolate reductase
MAHREHRRGLVLARFPHPPRSVPRLVFEGEISVGAGEVGGQALSLGLIDHVAIDIVPVVFGRGKPYFGTVTNDHLMLEDPEVVIQGDGVLHLRYAVHG